MTQPTMSSSAWKAVVAGGAGNVLEQYDNLIYGYSAGLLGTLFFPSSNATASLLASFGAFAVGFVVRPLGALVFGWLGDRFGRRSALVLSVALMAACTTLIGVLPTHATLGTTAAVLLLVLRLLQGLSVGGEWAGSTAFIVEYAPASRRGLYGSWQQVSTAIGFLLAAIVSAANTFVFDHETLIAGAWRIPFLLASVTGIIALWLRIGIAETPKFKEAVAEAEIVRNPIWQGLRTEFPNIARGFGFTLLWTVAYFLFLTFTPTYLTKFNGVDVNLSSLSVSFGIAVFAILIPFAGALSDRLGRKPMLLASTIGFIVLSWPTLVLMGSGGTPGLFGGWVILALLLAAFSGPGPAALAEMFPTEVRYSALSIGYNFSVALFGGTTPLLATALIAGTGLTTAPALLAMIAAAVTTIVVLTMRETFRKPLS